MAAPTAACSRLLRCLLLLLGVAATAGAAGETAPGGDCGCSANRGGVDGREAAARRYSAATTTAAAGGGRSAGHRPVSGGARLGRGERGAERRAGP